MMLTMKTIMLMILIFCNCIIKINGQEQQVSESQSESESESEEEVSLYFYLPDPNSPIIEYEAPKNLGNDRPAFLFASTPTGRHRLVEYYAHWCPHCQHFKQHYIDFATELPNVLKRYNTKKTNNNNNNNNNKIQIDTYAVSCVPHRLLCRDQGINGYPKLKLYLDGTTTGIDIDVWELHPFQILRYIPGIDNSMDLEEEEEENNEESTTTTAVKKQKNEILNIRNPNNKNNNNNQPKTITTNQEEFWLPRTKKDIYNDAYLSFDFTMRNNVFTTKGPLNNATSEALEEFLSVLQTSLPPTFTLSRLVGEIVSNFDTIKTNEDKLIEILDKYPPKRKTWTKSCSRDEPYGGYTCGLWELFHIMSVGYVEFNIWNIGDDWNYYHPSHLGETLRDFIEHFFGCEVCRMNFLHAYEACDHDRCNRLVHNAGEIHDWVEFPLWLFETHNSVNVRLLKERNERNNNKVSTTHKEEMNVQWPSRTACRACWHSDGRWDPDMIYCFLRVTYWPEDQTSKDYRKLLMKAAENIGDDGSYDDEDEYNHNRLFLWVIVGGILFLIVSATKERYRVARTGRHKKVDG